MVFVKKSLALSRSFNKTTSSLYNKKFSFEPMFWDFGIFVELLVILIYPIYRQIVLYPTPLPSLTPRPLWKKLELKLFLLRMGSLASRQFYLQFTCLAENSISVCCHFYELFSFSYMDPGYEWMLLQGLNLCKTKLNCPEADAF